MIIPLLLPFSLINCSICHPDALLVSGNSFSLYRFSLFFLFIKYLYQFVQCIFVKFIEKKNSSRYFKLQQQQILQASTDTSKSNRYYKIQQLLQSSADTSTDKIIMTCFSSWLLRSMSASLVIGNFSPPIIIVVSTSYTSPAWKQ